MNWFKKIIIACHYYLLNELLALLRKTLYNPPLPKAHAKILLVRKGNLGDWVCTLPALDAIKHHYPHATIDLLSTTGPQSVYGIEDLSARNIFANVFDANTTSWRELLGILRSQKYDVVIELPPDVDTFFNQLRNMAFFALAGIANGGGWYVSRTNLFSSYQAKHMYFENEQQRQLTILKQMSIDAAPDCTTKLFNKSDLGSISQLLPKQPFVVLAVGAKLEKKKWPLANFTSIVLRLRQKGLAIVAIGNEDDARQIDSIDSLDSIVNLCGKLSVAQSAAVLSQAAFCVSNDSAPMHLAYTLETPLVALFSARNYPGKWYPPISKSTQVLAHHEVYCSGCMNKPCENNICMQAISTDDVWQAIQKVYPLINA
jgi:ADP-heptose:LPS heptosyltransferase